MRKTLAVRLLEEREGAEIREIITRLFEEEGNVNRVAIRLGVPHNTVASWMRRLNLTVRHTITGG